MVEATLLIITILMVEKRVSTFRWYKQLIERIRSNKWV